jgi:methylase of polypeptide subunit release factors
LELVKKILDEAPEHLTPRGLLVCEIGENRKALERAYPSARFDWPQEEVFTLPRARMAGGSRKPATRAQDD